MKAMKSSRDLLVEARSLELESRLTEAAEAYQRVVDADVTNQPAVNRLLTLYRRLKEPKKELAVIESVLSRYAQKDKTAQEKWLATHPQAAKAGRAFMKSLGGATVSGFGTNPLVARLLKRKAVVEKKLGGKTSGTTKKKAVKKDVADEKIAAAAERKAATEEARREAAERKAATIAERRAKAEEKAARMAEKKAAAKAEKERLAAERRAAAEAALPSLFVVTLRYLASLEKVDAILPRHGAFLDKHIAAGVFLVAGRQEPRAGEIIIARGKDRAAVERVMRQDPMVQHKLASVDIVEFSADKLNKKHWQRLQ